jgi:predicted nucleic acid-binding protein
MAGRLRGKYPVLRALDAIQLSVAIDVEVDVFLTNDNKLKQIKEVKILILKDYL